MRRTVGLLFAVALLMPAGVLLASPAGAAAGKCTKITGSATFSPSLPNGSTKKDVTVKTVSKLTGCTGPGGSSGVATSTSKLLKSNCATFSAPAKKPYKPSKPATQQIKWVNGKTSTASSTLTPNGKPLQSVLKSTITAGIGKGSKTTATLGVTGANTKACAGKDLTKLQFASIGKVVTK